MTAISNVSAMSGHIFGGEYVNIAAYPYAAYLFMRRYSCGASILNQAILLSAAHCFYFDQNPNHIQVLVGNKYYMRGSSANVANLVMHKKYDHEQFLNDIALLHLEQELKFGKSIGRVILMQNPPYSEEAMVYGWGKTEVDSESEKLKAISQVVYNRNKCSSIGITRLPLGYICGEHRKKQGHPSSGDSGGALVIRSAIQIGIVSHNLPLISEFNTIYTDTAYYFNWIKKNARAIHCH